MTIRNLFPTLISLSLLTILSACGPTKPEIIQVNPAFNQYISGYTSGMVKRDQPIRIQLADAVEGLTEMKEEDLKEIIQIDPVIEYKIVTTSERSIEILPIKPLKMNQFFTVQLELDELREVKKGFETFAFQFSTFEQKIDVQVEGLNNYNDYQIEYQKLTGTIRTTDSEDTSKLRKTLQFSLNGKQLPFTFHDHYQKNTLRFTVDSIQRKVNKQAVVVSWNGDILHSFSRGVDTIQVSGLSDFELVHSKVIEDEDQRVELEFSEPLSPTQALDGIVRIDRLEGITYKIDYNRLTVFLPNRITGNHELLISSGLKNIAGFSMKAPIEKTLTFHEATPRLRFNGNGSILPNSQGLIFPFEAISLKSVDVRIIRILEKNVHHFLQVNELNGDDELTRFGKIIAEKKVLLTTNKKLRLKEWNTHIINLEQFIHPEPGAIYQVAIKFDKEDALCNCPASMNQLSETTTVEEELDLFAERPNWNEHFWHAYGFEGFSDWGYYDQEDDPCQDSYYYGKAIKRNILASDIGLLFKLDNDKRAHLFASNMISTAPMAGVEISLFDYVKNNLRTVTTDENGMATVQLTEKPFLMVAKKGTQRGYLKLTDGNSNSLSKFDVSGEIVQKGVKGFLYAEREVWRPGDSLYINFMLEDKQNAIPENYPVKFSLTDPSGNIVYSTSTARHLHRVYDFRTATSIDAPTGNYRGAVSIGNKVFEKSFKVESIKPNRLKITLTTDQGTAHDSCLLSSKWLHGASAKELKAEVKVRLNPMKTTFKNYKNYIFDSPIRSGSSDYRTVFSGNLDKNGEAKFTSGFSDFSHAQGMLQANYITKVYEKSGDFSIDRTISTFSPFANYVGLGVPTGSKYDGTLENNTDYSFSIVTVDAKGQPNSNVPINIRIYKLDWDWWFDANEDDFAQFTARNSAILYKELNTRTQNGKASFNFGLKHPEYGKFMIIATDTEGNHQTGAVIHIDWPYWSRSNRTENEFAKMLTFSTNKTAYTRGEKVKLSFPSPSDGRALVSIESSQRVLKKFWVATKKGETDVEFEATADMAPNAFLHVSLLQPHHATKNDLPIRLYGVKPIEVDDPATHLHPEIQMKDEIRPESKVQIRVSEKNGSAMTYTLAMVDDGLLDLTHFRTPQPWNTFFAKEALGVKTWDIYDDVIGAYSGKLENLLTIGGDGAAIVGNGPKANRFKPMVTHIGPFFLPAGGQKTHTFDIPNYIGAVRVMVVARNNGAYGNSDKTVTVKKPLMVLATAPRTLGPDEEFSLPVNVFAMEKHIKNVSVSVQENDLIDFQGAKNQTITFNEEGDQVVNFKLKVKQKVGVAKIKVSAVCGNERAVHEIELDVRPSNPIVHHSETVYLTPGKSNTFELDLDGIQGTNRGMIEISTLPAIQLDRRMSELIHYPHGCVEQTTSAVFPQLFLSQLTQLSKEKQAEITANVKAGIMRLQLFQTSSGGLGYWPGQSYENHWGTNYAGHFLLEAERLGYQLPVGMKQSWITFQKNAATNWSENRSTHEQLTQAYRLYLLALSGNPEIGAMNRLKESFELSDQAKWRLSGAYSLIGQPEIAERLTASIATTYSDYRELSQTFGSKFRDQAMTLEVLALRKDKTKGLKVLMDVAEKLQSDDWMSTQETAYSLLSIAKFCAISNEKQDNALEVTIDGVRQAVGTPDARWSQVAVLENERKTKRKISIRNTKAIGYFITVTSEKIPLRDQSKKEFSNLSLDVHYYNTEGKQLDVSTLSQGTEFIAEVTVTNPSKKRTYREMALTHIFPTSWEIHNHRLFDGGGFGKSPEYQDLRDDRVLSYFSLAPEQSITIRIALSATYQGTSYLPTIYAEAMYDRRIHAQVPGKWVRVVKEVS